MLHVAHLRHQLLLQGHHGIICAAEICQNSIFHEVVEFDDTVRLIHATHVISGAE